MWCGGTTVDMQGCHLNLYSSSHHYLPFFNHNNPLKEMFIKSTYLDYWRKPCAFVFVQDRPLKGTRLGKCLIQPSFNLHYIFLPSYLIFHPQNAHRFNLVAKHDNLVTLCPDLIILWKRPPKAFWFSPKHSWSLLGTP